MQSGESIVNKIIPIETIIEIANYLENQKDEYIRLYQIDNKKNEKLKYDERMYEYKSGKASVAYTIRYKDGREFTEEDYNWFIGNLANVKIIEKIDIYYYIDYFTNMNQTKELEHKTISGRIHFYEQEVRLHIEGKKLEELVHKNHSYIRGILENNDERYNKTVKSRKFRVQSFCLTIGFILSYLIYFILLGNKQNLSIVFRNLIDNKMVLILGQWFISILIGNILGYPIMMALYRNILPKTKYSHYSRSSKKSVYIDNIEDYISHNEVQIGKFANNGKNRVIIEKIYKITSKVVLIQLVISTIFFLVIK